MTIEDKAERIMKIVYVILHYMAEKETIECTKSILDVSSQSCHDVTVIIVDNGSPNNSIIGIENAFENEEDVVILKAGENLGFAKGNNIGFQYAKHNLHADFIVQINNDTIIQQIDFNDKIVQIYQDYNYAVLGPDIITLDGCHQNPGKDVVWSTDKLIRFRLKKKIQYYMTYFPFLDRFLKINQSAYSKEKTDEMVFDTTLHGACYIFSRDYISRFEGMYDKTFLYMEEDILRLRSIYLKYKMMYSPEIEILHKEDVATNMSSSNSIKKKRNVYRNLLNSSKVYMKLKREYERGSKCYET